MTPGRTRQRCRRRARAQRLQSCGRRRSAGVAHRDRSRRRLRAHVRRSRRTSAHRERRELAALRRHRGSLRNHLTLRFPLARGASHLEPQRSPSGRHVDLEVVGLVRRRSSAARRSGSRRPAGSGAPSLAAGNHVSGPCAFCSETLTMLSGVMLISRTRCRTPAFQVNTGAGLAVDHQRCHRHEHVGRRRIDAAPSDHHDVIDLRLVRPGRRRRRASDRRARAAADVRRAGGCDT